MSSARDAKGFIDGDLVEGFLDQPLEKQQEILTAMGPGPALGDVIKLLEDLARMH